MTSDSGAGRGGLRLAVYCDYSYREGPDGLTAELPFSLFVEGLAPHCERLVVIGRRDPGPQPFPYRVRQAELAALPYYGSGADLRAVLSSIPAALRSFWRVLRDVDVVWVLGPNPPQAILFALLARLRGRRVALGVRQNLPELIRHRRPDRRAVILAASVLEGAFRLLSRRMPTIVVGPDLAARYARAPRLLDIYVSLLRSHDVLSTPPPRDFDADERVIISVGRLDPEKNPLLLADILARVVQHDPRWRMEVVGDGTLADALDARARELGVAGRMHRRGYVPIDAGLWELYRDAHVLLHVSLTEGVPQVLLEAFAAGLPVVATEVGGVGPVVRGCGLLIGPADADAGAQALTRMADDRELRERLVRAGTAAAGDHTLEAECARVAGFLSMNS